MNPAIKSKIVPGIAEVLAYVIASTETDVDDNVMSELADALAEVQARSADTGPKEVLEGTFKILDGVTDLTPTEIDDTIVNVAQGVLEFGGMSEKVTNWVSGWFK